MSDPRKNFKCVKCGVIVNDLDREWGSDTPCQNCMMIELKEKLRKEKKAKESVKNE